MFSVTALMAKNVAKTKENKRNQLPLGLQGKQTFILGTALIVDSLVNSLFGLHCLFF